MSANDKLSLVLPCRNQADHIGQVLPRYLRSLEALGIPFELVVVPNASTDGTLAVVEELARGDERIKVVSNPAGGWGLSVRTGLRAASGTILAYTNTARTDPDSVPLFVQRFQTDGRCLVKARREARHAPLREAGSFLYNLEARLLLGVRCRDVNGTPKVFSRELYDGLALTADGDLLDLELMSWAARRGMPIVEIPVRGFQRHGGKSSTTWKSAWKMYSGAVRLWWNGRWWLSRNTVYCSGTCSASTKRFFRF
jgi:glycosyltransferase involved in cell wall biosynthesis